MVADILEDSSISTKALQLLRLILRGCFSTRISDNDCRAVGYLKLFSLSMPTSVTAGDWQLRPDAAERSKPSAHIR